MSIEKKENDSVIVPKEVFNCTECPQISRGFLGEANECGYFKKAYEYFVPRCGLPEWCPMKQVKHDNSIKEKLRNIKKVCDEIEERNQLMIPLARHLLPIRKRMDIDGVPLEGREVLLKTEDWEEQYKRGIDKCVGIDIKWGGINNAIKMSYRYQRNSTAKGRGYY